MAPPDLLAAWRAAPFAEVAWMGDDGPDATAVVPLVDRGRPAMALTYDRIELARRLATAGRVLLGVTCPTLNAGRTPVTAWADVEVAGDPDGDEFAEHLLDQELAKHPPSRPRADSLLLRSEHRWYLPRLLVRTTNLASVHEHPLRDALALVDRGDERFVDTVDLDDPGPAGSLGSALPDGRAVVLQHGADLPDLERPWRFRWRGEVVGGRWRDATFEQRPRVIEPQGVWRRWRDEVAFEKACRAGLRRADPTSDR